MTNTTGSIMHEGAQDADGPLPLRVLWCVSMQILWATRARTWPGVIAVAVILAANYAAAAAYGQVAQTFLDALVVMSLVNAALILVMGVMTRAMLAVRNPWSVDRGLGVYLVVSLVLGMAAQLPLAVILASFKTGVEGFTIAGAVVLLVLFAVVCGIQVVSIRLTLWLVARLLGDTTSSLPDLTRRMRGAVGSALLLWILLFGGALFLARFVIHAISQALGVTVDGDLAQTILDVPTNVILIVASAALWRLRNGREAMAAAFD